MLRVAHRHGSSRRLKASSLNLASDPQSAREEERPSDVPNVLMPDSPKEPLEPITSTQASLADAGTERSRTRTDTLRRYSQLMGFANVYTLHSSSFKGADDHRETGVIEEAHDTEVFCAIYVGDFLASCSLDGCVAVRDARTHALLARRDRGAEGSHADGVFQLAGHASSPGEGCLFSIDWGGHIKAWGLPGMVLLSTTLAHPKELDMSARYGGFSLACSRTGQFLASGGGDGSRSLKLWQLSDDYALSLLAEVGHCHDIVFHLDFAPQTDLLVSIGSEHVIKLWSIPDLALVTEKHDANGGSNKHAIFSPDGETLATCGSDLHIKLWVVPSLELKISRDEAHSSEIRRIAYSPDGSTIASCSLDASLRLWSAVALSPIGHLESAHAGKIFHVVYPRHDGGRTITTCGADHSIKVWATATLAMTAGAKFGAFAARDVIGIGFVRAQPPGGSSSAGQGPSTAQAGGSSTLAQGASTVVVGVGSDLSVKMWTLPAFAELARERGSEQQSFIESRKAALSPDYTLLAAMHGRDGFIRVWAIEASEPAHRIVHLFEQQLHLVPSYAVAFTHDSRGIVTGSEDGSIASWRLDESRSKLVKVDAEAKAHGGDYIANVACHPDGLMLASMSVLSTLKMWSLVDGQILHQLFELKRAHRLDANSHLLSGLAFSPDGRLLCTSGDVLKLWAVKTNSIEELREMKLAARATVAFSPDSKTIALGRDDGAIACYFAAHLPEADSGLFERGLAAVQLGDPDAIRALPPSVLGARDFRRNTFGWTLLHHACRLLDVLAVETLLEISPHNVLDALAPPFAAIMRGKNHTLRIRPTPRDRPAWPERRASEVPIVPSVLEVALKADAKGCIALILETLTALVHEDPNNACGACEPIRPERAAAARLRATGSLATRLSLLIPRPRPPARLLRAAFARTRSGKRLMAQLMAVGGQYPELLAALLPALGFAHQPSGKCTANLEGTKQMYVFFSDAPTPYSLAASRGLELSREGVRKFWSTKALYPRPRIVPDEDPSLTHLSKSVLKRTLMRKKTGTNYTSCVVPFAGNFIDFLVCIEGLNGRSTRSGLYDNSITIAIVKAFWRNGAGRVHMYTFVAYVILLVLVVMFAVAPSRINGIVLIVIGAPFIMMEAFAFATAESLGSYVASAFNWADVVNYVLIFVIGFPGLVQAEAARRIILAILIVLMGFKTLYFLRAYTTLVGVILQAIKDIRAFTLIVILILVSFAIAIDVLEDVAVSEASLLTLFGLMLGAFEVDTYAVDAVGSALSIVLQILFYMFALLVAIVLLNLLIAILGDSYDVVTEKKKAEYVRMRAQLVIEYARLFPSLLRQQGRWLHVLVRTSIASEQRFFELEEEGAADDEWNSRLTQLKGSVATIRKEAEEHRLRAEWKIETVRNELTDRIEGTRKELTAKLDSVLEQLGRVQQATASAEGGSFRKQREPPGKRDNQSTMANPPEVRTTNAWSFPGILR
jgi:WD40 repeat protein